MGEDNYNEMDFSEEEKFGEISEDVVDKMHFGGFEKVQDGEKKSKHQVMQEIIAKSKFYKHERQEEKRQDEEMRIELDNELKEIRGMLNRAPLPPQTNEFQHRQENVADVADVENEYDEYDLQVRELTFEKRARPSERTKTEEEIAVEEKEKLEKAEMQRIRRMQGLDSDSEFDIGQGLEAASKLKKKSKFLEIVEETDQQLPFSFPAPKNYSDFLKLVKGLSAENQATVVQRLRTLYHVSLGTREHLQVYASFK